MAYYSGYNNTSSGVKVVSVPLSTEKISTTIYINWASMPKHFDLWDENDYDSMHVPRNALVQVNFYNNRGVGNRIWIHRFEVWKTIEGDLNKAELFYVENLNKEATRRLNNDQMTYWGISMAAEHVDGTHDEAYYEGKIEFYIKLKWSDKKDNIFYSWFKPGLARTSDAQMIEDLTVHRPILKGINGTAEIKKTFYKYEKFSLGAGLIEARYVYYVNGKDVSGNGQTNNFTSSPYAVGDVIRETGRNIPVTIRFGDAKPISYDIDVFGVNEAITFPALPKMPDFIPIGADVANLKSQYLWGTITYEDNTTSRERASTEMSAATIGVINLQYRLRVPKFTEYSSDMSVVVDRGIIYGDGPDGKEMEPHYYEDSGNGGI